MAPNRMYKCENILLENEIVAGGICVDGNGKIMEVLRGSNIDQFAQDMEIIEIKSGVLMPGIVDSHVHVNCPGRCNWEDYPCATRAAAAGGVTTIADMPLNSIPPTTTLENLNTKTNVARGNIYVDVAFWGGVIPGNDGELQKLVDAGVVGFKCFLCPSGVDEFPNVEREDLEKALSVLEKTNSVLAFHAEKELTEEDKDELPDSHLYSTYLNSRPGAMEKKALNLIKELSSKYNARYHIVHVSASSGVEIINEMKDNKVKITCETCPHYLSFAAEHIPISATEFKCAPPIRNENNREVLWNSIKNGSIDMIVSDHSPCTPNLKTENFMTSWGGISSVQFGLSIIWTHSSGRGVSLIDISKWMSSKPAQLCRIDHYKGHLKPGYDADFIIFDPEQEFTVQKEMIHHKNKLTPYLGNKLKGKVLQTYVRGNLVYEDGKFSDKPLGKLLL